jgi:hypothetical protein
MTLQQLAETSLSRAEMRTRGLMCLTACSALHRVGYQVRIWAFPGRGFVYEYNPIAMRVTRSKRSGTGETVYHREPVAGLPRLTADTFERQAAIHRALGLIITGPGRDWVDHGAGQRGLFDLEGDTCG